MITVLKDHSEVITGDFRDGNKEYNLLIAEKRMLLKEFEEKLNPKETMMMMTILIIILPLQIGIMNIIMIV